MNRTLLAAVILVASAAWSSSSLAQSKIEPIAVQRVDIQRNGSSCSGEVIYRFEAKALALKADLGVTTRVLPIVVPCANLDALTTYKPLPNDRGGQLSFALERVEFYLRDDATCAVDATYTRAPTDADLLAVYGTSRIVVQYRNNACVRMTNALVGALIKSGASIGWPTSVVPLPLSVEP